MKSILLVTILAACSGAPSAPSVSAPVFAADHVQVAVSLTREAFGNDCDTLTPQYDPLCSSNSDCNGHGTCSGGTCNHCSSNSDCKSGTCSGGKCGGCSSNSDCHGNGTCSGGTCGHC